MGKGLMCGYLGFWVVGMFEGGLFVLFFVCINDRLLFWIVVYGIVNGWLLNVDVLFMFLVEYGYIFWSM